MDATAKPSATATIEPLDRLPHPSREHVVKLTIKLSPGVARYGDRGYANGLARQALAGFSPTADTPDRRRYDEVTAKSGKEMNAIAVEGTVVWPERPGAALITALRATLLDEGYRIAVRELRLCGHESCAAEIMVEWDHPLDVPRGWHSAAICGKHDYRTCATCGSVYRMSAVSSAGQAESVHCQVCGVVMIEWGSSKIWIADLVTRGAIAPKA